jgi:hypothetical protein
MIRHSMFAALALSLSAAACNNAADDQAKADKAQAEANAKIDQARAEADAKMKSAQASADKSITQAEADFMKMREDYRHATMSRLVALDKKIADLEIKASTAAGKRKADLDVALKQIHAARDQFAADFRALEGASATTWDDAKARLDKELSDMRSLADAA